MTWAFDHPAILGDTTGEFGYLGNVDGPVFFAQGSGGEPFKGSVKVPRGEYVLLPVATYIWTFFDPCAEIGCARRIINSNFIKDIEAAGAGEAICAGAYLTPAAPLTSRTTNSPTTTQPPAS